MILIYIVFLNIKMIRELFALRKANRPKHSYVNLYDSMVTEPQQKSLVPSEHMKVLRPISNSCQRPRRQKLTMSCSKTESSEGKPESYYKHLTKGGKGLLSLNLNPIECPGQSNKFLLNEQQREIHSHFSYRGTRRYNQDQCAIHSNVKISFRAYHLYAVFDGHGGNHTSNFLKSHFQQLFHDLLHKDYDFERALRRACEAMENWLSEEGKSQNNGACATICVCSEGNLYIANIGDCRALELLPSGECRALTEDHKPQSPEERKRIRESGGEIYRNFNEKTNSHGPYRLYPGNLSVSRSFGDFQVKGMTNSCLIATPSISVFPVNKSATYVLMSDGLYEKMTNQNIAGCFSKNNVAKGVSNVIAEAKCRRTTDNTSVVAFQLL